MFKKFVELLMRIVDAFCGEPSLESTSTQALDAFDRISIDIDVLSKGTQTRWHLMDDTYVMRLIGTAVIITGAVIAAINWIFRGLVLLVREK